MFRRLTLACLIATTLSLSSQRPTPAQTPPSSAPPTHAAIEPLMDAQTLAVAWLDLKEVDIAQTGDFIVQSFRPGATRPSNADAGPQKILLTVREALLNLKATRVYWVAESTTISMGANSVVIPTPNPDGVKLLLQSMINPSSQKIATTDNLVIAGNSAQVDSLLKKQGTISPVLNKELDANKEAHGAVALTPSTMTSLLITLPTFREKFGNSPEQLGSAIDALVALQSISLSAKLPPEQVSLQLNFASAEGAEKASSVLGNFIGANYPALTNKLVFTREDAKLIAKSSSLEQSRSILSGITSSMTPFDIAEQQNRMKQVNLALHIYHEANGRFPPQSLVDSNGKKLLSWRVLILPYMEQQALYNQFHLDEPWDSPHNLQVASAVPVQYGPAVSDGQGPPKTRLIAPLTENSVFGKSGKPVRLQNITDGTSNTIWLMQVDRSHAVPWTKPDDVVIDTTKPINSISDLLTPEEALKAGERPFICGMADGSVRTLTTKTLEKWLLPLVSIDGGEVINLEN